LAKSREVRPESPRNAEISNHMKTKTKHFPDFTASRYESEIINQIANRAVAVAISHGVKGHDKQSAYMDIEACHCNGMPLDLGKLLAADEFNFAHDIFGIRRHINRKTGEIEGCFVPRCALPEPKANEVRA
jgi:hypothetical protein